MINTDEYQNKSFFNPYLKSVAFEIRIPSSINIMKNIEIFQEKINDIYPDYKTLFPLKLSIPLESETHYPLLTHQFFDKSESNEVRVQHNSIAFITKDYQKFKYFYDNVTKVIDAFIPSYKIKNCFRVGLRYTNEYFIDNKDISKVKIELKENFNSFLSNNLEEKYNIIGNQVILAIEEEEKNITLKSIVKYIKETNNYLYLLDFDAYYLNEINIKNYKLNLKELRKVQKSYFLSFIKSKFIEKMKFYDEEEI